MMLRMQAFPLTALALARCLKIRGVWSSDPESDLRRFASEKPCHWFIAEW